MVAARLITDTALQIDECIHAYIDISCCLDPEEAMQRKCFIVFTFVVLFSVNVV